MAFINLRDKTLGLATAIRCPMGNRDNPVDAKFYLGCAGTRLGTPMENLSAIDTATP
jgi:hypothetical protein